MPQQPGVYSMFDARARLIYVGQSKNLRQRVGSYRSIHPDRSSRKLVHLVHAVERINWEVCESPEAALIRENDLLRTHRPKFNSLNTYPKAHVFIGLRNRADSFEFCYTRELPRKGDYQFFGAFKTGALLGFQSLLRLIWTALHRPEAPYDYPRQLLQSVPARQFVFGTRLAFVSGRALLEREDLIGFLNGGDSSLLELLRVQMSAFRKASAFMDNWLKADLENAEMFFQNSLLRNFNLRKEFDVKDALIRQEELDDFIVRRKYLGQKAPGVECPIVGSIVNKEGAYLVPPISKTASIAVLEHLGFFPGIYFGRIDRSSRPGQSAFCRLAGAYRHSFMESAKTVSINITFRNFWRGIVPIPIDLSEHVCPKVIRSIKNQTHA